ncbi:MAG: spore coat protein [Clostridiaceae bacterium]|nr:spore coat protein [Clostridiaceae bacterium]
MNKFGDKEITQTILNEHKLCASSLTNLVLESSNQNLRNDVEGILNRTFQHQKAIFDLMSQKGWYSSQMASAQEMSTAKQEVSKIQSSMNMM